MPKPFGPIESAVRALIIDRYPSIGTRVGRSPSYVYGQEPYIQVVKTPGGGTNLQRGEWALDISVHDDNYLNAETIAGELEVVLLSVKGAKYGGIRIDSVSQNQAPSSRPAKDERAFEVGTIYVFDARRED